MGPTRGAHRSAGEGGVQEAHGRWAAAWAGARASWVWPVGLWRCGVGRGPRGGGDRRGGWAAAAAGLGQERKETLFLFYKN